MEGLQKNGNSKAKHLKKFELLGRLPRTTSKLWEMDRFDPFQLYQVCHKKCLILQVEVYNGVNITKGWWGDMLDVPDPYLILHVKGTPNRRKRTPVIDNCHNPEWNVCFQFFIDPSETRELYVTLMDSNYLMDQEMGTKAIDLSNFIPGVEERVTVDYENGAKVYMKLSMVEDKKPNLRFSLALSDDEKYFVKRRRMHIFEAMKKFLGQKHAPKEPSEVPVIAVLGSGGGFRATMSFAGVFKALDESGLLDCVMYVASLSGSSWFLSCLYSHPDFPHLLSPGDLIPELRKRMAKSWTKLLTPVNMYHYMKQVISKSSQGQPVSFTDFFGHLVGDTLLIERKGSLLSDQRAKLARGQAPLPLYTCLNVKKDVSARVFQDWMEFSPYEIGCAKYGTFLRTEDFGSKFYVGKLLLRFKESPLHFLMGVWGSAFCILFKRLIAEGKKTEIPQMLREDSQGKPYIHQSKSLDDEIEDREDYWKNTLPIIGEDSELYGHYTDCKSNLKRNCKENGKDEMMMARDILRKRRLRVITSIKLKIFRKRYLVRVKFKPRTESGSPSVLWGDMEDNCDSGSSESEMEISEEEISESEMEGDLTSSTDEMQKQKKEDCVILDGDITANKTFATEEYQDQKTKLRKFSRQKAMDVVEDNQHEKEVSHSREKKRSVPLVLNKIKGEQGKERRHSDVVTSLTLKDKGSRRISLQGLDDVNAFVNTTSSFTKLGVNDNNDAKDTDLTNDDKCKRQRTFWKEQRKNRRATQRKVQSNFWKSVLESIFQSGGLGDTRAGRAGLIFNPLRGLSLQQTFPISPLNRTTAADDHDFQGFHEAVEVQAKKLYLVDSGLTFNSPFPLLLRPQRAVDIYLSFDFSGRPTDFHEPFKEIMLAEKWARLNCVPFPPVAELAKKFLTEPLREIYVFDNPNESNCPIIIHFIIFNGQFREFKAPGIRRETEEEKDFADFKIFSDPEDTYSMFHFCYNNLQFNRICQLMEFNTQLGMKIVRKCIRTVIQQKRSCLARGFSQKSSEIFEEVEDDSEDSDEELFYDTFESIP